MQGPPATAPIQSNKDAPNEKDDEEPASPSKETKSFESKIQSLDVMVPSFETKTVDGKSVTFFAVTFAVLPKGRTWSLQKRYSDFDALNTSLAESHPNMPKLPGKTMSSMFSLSDGDLQ